MILQTYQFYQGGQLMRVSEFEKTSPQRVFNKAANYTKRLNRYHQLPKNISKSMVVRNQAEKQKEDIEFAIKKSKFQLELFRKKQSEDIMRRSLLQKKIMSAAAKVAKNEKDISAKKFKSAQLYEKHLKDVYKKFEDEQRRHRLSQKQQSYKLCKQLQQFYDKQAQRRKDGELRQISVSACYKGAVDKLDNIHQQNEEYSGRAEQQLNKQLQKNNHLGQILSTRKRSLYSINQQKNNVYEESLSILNRKENTFIQKYGRNQDGSLSAFKLIEEEKEKQKKRLHDFFKTRVEKWSQQKKRVDASKAEISQKCSSILERTNNSFFRQTVSSFRSTAKEWLKLVQKNKSQIRTKDEMKKDEIMEGHLNLGLKNRSISKVSEKMMSMRLQAKKLASDFS